MAIAGFFPVYFGRLSVEGSGLIFFFIDEGVLGFEFFLFLGHDFAHVDIFHFLFIGFFDDFAGIIFGRIEEALNSTIFFFIGVLTALILKLSHDLNKRVVYIGIQIFILILEHSMPDIFDRPILHPYFKR